MKNIKSILIFTAAAFILSSCNKHDGSEFEETLFSSDTASLPFTTVSEISETAPETDFPVSGYTVTDADTGNDKFPMPENDEPIVSEDGVIYSADGKTLISFPSDRTGEFTVPDGVETIGEKAFYQSKLTNVVLPDGLKRIGEGAFCESSLTRILLPESLIEIDRYAFRDSALESIKLNEGLKSIGALAFAHTNIRGIYLPDSIESCAMIFGQSEDNPTINVPSSAARNDGMLAMRIYKNIIFRNETDLEHLLRRAETRSGYENCIFADLDGDNFPEMACLERFREIKWYQFDTSSGEWNSIFRMLTDTELKLYYDRENDEYFYICPEMAKFPYTDIYYPDEISKVYLTENGLSVNKSPFGDFDYNYISHFENMEKIVDKYVGIGYAGNKFYIDENTPDFFTDTMNEALSSYELICTVDIEKIIEEYADEYNKYKTVLNSFADSPEPSEYKRPPHTDAETDCIFIGNIRIPVNSTFVHLQYTEINEEAFEKLSLLPNLKMLSIGNRYKSIDSGIDLTGISRLSGLECLRVFGYEITGASEIGKLENLKALGISSYADDLSFLADLNNVIILEFDSTFDKPFDFYTPVYDMKNLRYIVVGERLSDMTEVQSTHISENAPHITILYRSGI